MNNKTIGIIGAMDCEINKLKSKLQNLQEIKKGKLLINIGILHGHNVIVVKSGVGKVNAALCAQYCRTGYALCVHGAGEYHYRRTLPQDPFQRSGLGERGDAHACSCLHPGNVSGSRDHRGYFLLRSHGSLSRLCRQIRAGR